MNANDIRKNYPLAQSPYNPGDGSWAEFNAPQAGLFFLREIAAQLAEQNEYLLKVLEFNTAQLENSKRSVDWMIERDKRAEQRAIDEMGLIAKMEDINKEITKVAELISPAPVPSDALVSGKGNLAESGNEDVAQS